MITMQELMARLKASGRMTAAESTALFETCPEWVEQRDRKEAARRAAEDGYRDAQAGLLADLAAVEIDVTSVWDLVNSPTRYAAAVPVLLRHLGRPYPTRVREGLARSLTAQEATGIAGPGLIDALKRETDPEVRWALANALTIVAGPGDILALRALLADPGYADVYERLRKAEQNLFSS